MKFDELNFGEIKKYFPNLYLINGEIHGEIDFLAKYTQNNRGQWVIESCVSENRECLYGRYEIKVILDNAGIPHVFEVGGKIKSLARHLGINIVDLHVNRDGSCCLDFYLNINRNLILSEFILNKVYPYFVWQAYYEKFKKPPPSGEYSHGIKAVYEFFSDIASLGRNDSCICGSGKKFKKCCLKYIQCG
ncbi:SEC-C metal-binding domain-containing protein [Thiothrix unzii]|jgi:hypothetical protein|uniref:SEC-C metal-binding domain-containing protein n=1 Tax=Thiothrix unzii TaxID=111769 RepID=UPI002A35C1CD|nr:SEC-C metal-binding domain-containing protein [Thiothrix unzii]MDX9987040.1 SEC-C metal-binding domain-containing protein [Thiothrix unzii]